MRSKIYNASLHDACLVLIYSDKNETEFVGMGTLVNRKRRCPPDLEWNLIVTCAHVVADALDFPKEEDGLTCHSGKPAKSKKSLRRRFFGGGGRSDCSADLRGLTLA